MSYALLLNRVLGTSHQPVPYSRLVDYSPTGLLPPKLDSDSKLHTADHNKSILSVPETEAHPKSSASDSRLAVDYFVSEQETQPNSVSQVRICLC